MLEDVRNREGQYNLAQHIAIFARRRRQPFRFQAQRPPFEGKHWFKFNVFFSVKIVFLLIFIPFRFLMTKKQGKKTVLCLGNKIGKISTMF